MSQIAPITLTAPGRYGLNTEQENNILSPEWATSADNCVLTRSGRIGARKGWANQTANAIAGTPSIDVLFEYMNAAGTTTVISSANNKIYKDIDDYTDVLNDITPTPAPTADHWQFFNFNGKVIGVQDGHTPIVWTGSSTFAPITAASGSLPTGNCGTAAFGRVWIADTDGQTLKYSALLDETHWSTGAGSIDMSSVWTQGIDRIVAIKALGSNLIVFGRNHIVIWADGSGSDIGIDPTTMYVTDTVEGTGCIARDSVQPIGEGDLAYLSRHGIQLLGRVIANRSNPVETVTRNIKGYLQGLLDTQKGSDAGFDQVRAVFSPENAFYLLLLPVPDVFIVIDTRHMAQDDEGGLVGRTTNWSMGGSIKSVLSRRNGNLLFGSAGVVGLYSGSDDNGTSFSVDFMTGWLDFGELNNALKMLKELSTIVQIGGSASVSWKWEYDFTGVLLTKTVAYTGASQAEYGIAEYNVDEWAGGLTIQKKNFPGRGQGQFIRVGLSISLGGFDFILQQIRLIPKIGRMTT